MLAPLASAWPWLTLRSGSTTAMAGPGGRQRPRRGGGDATTVALSRLRRHRHGPGRDLEVREGGLDRARSRPARALPAGAVAGDVAGAPRPGSGRPAAREGGVVHRAHPGQPLRHALPGGESVPGAAAPTGEGLMSRVRTQRRRRRHRRRQWQWGWQCSERRTPMGVGRRTLSGLTVEDHQTLAVELAAVAAAVLDCRDLIKAGAGSADYCYQKASDVLKALKGWRDVLTHEARESHGDDTARLYDDQGG